MMKIQFQDGGGEVRSRVQMENIYGVTPGYVARSLNRGLQERGGGFEVTEFIPQEADENAADLIINFHPELTEPPLTDDEVWCYAASLMGQSITD